MTHEEKIDHLMADLKERGLPREWADPPVLRALRRFGLKVPPLCFLDSWIIVVCIGVPMAIFWGLAMHLFQRTLGWNTPIIAQVLVSAMVGLVPGVIVAYSMHRKRKELGLPSWRDYPEATCGDR